MIQNREEKLDQKDLESINKNKKIASILIQDVAFNIMINKQKSELSDKEYFKWFDQMKRLDQQKSVLIKDDEQYQKQLNQVNIKQTQKHEQLGFFGQMKQQLQLEKIFAQIKKKKAQIELELIIRQIQTEIEIQKIKNQKVIEKNQQIIEEIQEEQGYIVNDEIMKNSNIDEVEMEKRFEKLKYQSKKASKVNLFKTVFKSLKTFEKQNK